MQSPRFISISETDRGQHGKMALMLAIKSGSLAMLQWLLQKGFDVAEVDGSGETALWFAIQRDAVEFVAMLLNAGADSHQMPEMGWKNITVNDVFSLLR